jgi:AbrB family looped-hinge helix DNA binding protein
MTPYALSDALRNIDMAKGFGEEQQRGLISAPATNLRDNVDVETTYAKLKIGPGARVVIPTAIRELLGVAEGDTLMATFEGGELKLVSLTESVRRAQAMVRKRVPAGVSLVDQLLEERQQEVLAEHRRG